MGFAWDNVEFTEDNIETEMELFTVIDESSVVLRFYRSGRVFRILVGSLRVKNCWSEVQESGLWNGPSLVIFLFDGGWYYEGYRAPDDQSPLTPK